MIFYATNGQAAGPAVATAVQEHAFFGRTFQAQAADGPPVESDWVEGKGDSVELKPRLQEVVEDFDWRDPQMQRRFIRLEQKVLAKKASQDEVQDYQNMKRDRNGSIFADRQVRDYAEVQRLRKLGEKLAEVQKYLRPLEI